MLRVALALGFEMRLLVFWLNTIHVFDSAKEPFWITEKGWISIE